MITNKSCGPRLMGIRLWQDEVEASSYAEGMSGL